jgi:hypothetical protein
MAVLVEALSLIVPRHVLDVSWPGGTDAYLAELGSLPTPPRFACADDRLTSVSFWSPEEAELLMQRLIGHGVIDVDDDRAAEMVVVDQRHGPVMPCDWLAWERHAEGYTSCWLADTEPGTLVAPDDWTPERSRRLVRQDIRDEPDRFMKLGERNGLEIWLDTETGRESAAVPRPAEQIEPEAAEEVIAEGMLAVAVRTLREEGCRYVRTAANEVEFIAEGKERKARCRIIALDEHRQVVCYTEFGPRVPAPFIPAVAETLLRINDGIVFGNFDLEFRTGRVRFKAAMALNGAELTPGMVRTMVSVGLSAMDVYAERILEVASGAGRPEEVA